MGPWIVVVLAGLVVVVAAIVVRRRRARMSRSSRTPTFPRKLRVSWPPGYSDDRPIRVVDRPNALYLIEEFASRRAALEFLRGCEVRDERIYVIAETPAGNLGKDLIMIFEEADGRFVEIAERSALPSPRRSDEDCARCDYSMMPAGAPEPIGDVDGEHVSVTYYLNLEELELKGHGFRCELCGGLAWPVRGATGRRFRYRHRPVNSTCGAGCVRARLISSRSNGIPPGVFHAACHGAR
ncbi:hypothetical protein [Protofrankia symbiont of Coriaria ruscifolia]|uniref:hypothetical protein n=1 Tax=Protofrankia symbiont of Coriaria ruscifolia TaxID=1306542 RepID=UPI00104150B3|nr:hypothetical protein [Protofrankia symbiont of Coriaria ruscifolia]